MFSDFIQVQNAEDVVARVLDVAEINADVRERLERAVAISMQLGLMFRNRIVDFLEFNARSGLKLGDFPSHGPKRRCEFVEAAGNAFADLIILIGDFVNASRENFQAGAGADMEIGRAHV